MIKSRTLSYFGHEEERRKLPGERDHAGHGTGGKKARETMQRMRWIDNKEKWTGMSFWSRKTRGRGSWRRLVQKATSPQSEDGQRHDKASIRQRIQFKICFLALFRPVAEKSANDSAGEINVA